MAPWPDRRASVKAANRVDASRVPPARPTRRKRGPLIRTRTTAATKATSPGSGEAQPLRRPGEDHKEEGEQGAGARRIQRDRPSAQMENGSAQRQHEQRARRRHEHEERDDPFRPERRVREQLPYRCVRTVGEGGRQRASENPPDHAAGDGARDRLRSRDDAELPAARPRHVRRCQSASASRRIAAAARMTNASRRARPARR